MAMQADTKQFYLAKNCSVIKKKPGCGDFSGRLAEQFFPYEPQDEHAAIKSGRLGNGNCSDFEKYRLFKELASFINAYYNAEEIKRRGLYKDTILSAGELFRLSSSNLLSEKQKQCCDSALAAFAYIITGSPSVMNMKDCLFVLRISKYHIRQKSGIAPFKADAGPSDFAALRLGSIWIHSFWAVLNMMFKYNDHEAQEIILSLMKDSDPGIRREALCVLPYFFYQRPGLFWEIVSRRARVEKNGCCLWVITSVLSGKDIKRDQQQSSILAELESRVRELDHADNIK